MSSPRPVFPWLLPPLLAAVAVAVCLPVVLLLQAMKAGSAEFLTLAWILAFVLMLPAALLVLPMASRIAGAVSARSTIPFAGVKIPGLGQ